MRTIPVTVETSSQSETLSHAAPTGNGYYPAYVLRGGAKRKRATKRKSIRRKSSRRRKSGKRVTTKSRK